MDNMFLVFIIIVVSMIYLNYNAHKVEIIDFKKRCTCQDVSCRFYSNYTDINRSKKTKIFVHISQERNERNWLDFGSRSTTDLNMDICILCIESIITFCDKQYEIILYTNNDVMNMIPDDELCSISEPGLLSGVDLKQWETYCKFKILELYGGIVMCPYFLFRAPPPQSFYSPKTLTVCEMSNEGLQVSNLDMIPYFGSMMASPKNDKNVKFYVKYLKYLCQNHYSADTEYFNSANDQLNKVLKFPSEAIGTTDTKGKPLYLENLFSNEHFYFPKGNFCIFVNIELLKRSRKYGWILKMSKCDMTKSNLFFFNSSRLLK